MKTILYQPLFINPQAYFVFPQLYHIEKGDSYIEPANITGQLIINDLTKVLTSTPTLNLDDTDVLIIGAAQRNVNNKIQDPYIGCHGNILIFNRTLTEYELSWVKNNMMCSKQQEPDIDL